VRGFFCDLRGGARKLQKNRYITTQVVLYFRVIYSACKDGLGDLPPKTNLHTSLPGAGSYTSDRNTHVSTDTLHPINHWPAADLLLVDRAGVRLLANGDAADRGYAGSYISCATLNTLQGDIHA
jgi:hypothetical protein